MLQKFSHAHSGLGMAAFTLDAVMKGYPIKNAFPKCFGVVSAMFYFLAFNSSPPI